MKKTRHTCKFCGAKKYQKYMLQGVSSGPKEELFWRCKNPDKCVNRSANYKK